MAGKVNPVPEDNPGIDPPLPMSVTFIPATVFDNPALLRVNPEYLAWLLSLPTLERERLLAGYWKIRPAAGLYFKREWCSVVDEAPADLNIVRYWDLAATKKPSSTIWIGRSASSSATIGAAAIGCWIWCGREPTRGTSNGYCSVLPSKAAKTCASGSARIRG